VINNLNKRRDEIGDGRNNGRDCKHVVGAKFLPNLFNNYILIQQ